MTEVTNNRRGRAPPCRQQEVLQQPRTTRASVATQAALTKRLLTKTKASLTNASSSASIGTLLDMGRGKLKTGVPDLVYGAVDVRDVARAHLLAAFNPDASGRYILVSESVSMLDIAATLRKQFGNQYPFPKMKVPKPMVWLSLRCSLAHRGRLR